MHPINFLRVKAVSYVVKVKPGKEINLLKHVVIQRCPDKAWVIVVVKSGDSYKPFYYYYLPAWSQGMPSQSDIGLNSNVPLNRDIYTTYLLSNILN